MKRASILLIASLGLAGCGQPTAPSKSESLNYLNSQVPAVSSLEFTGVEMENYPQGDGRCRIKIKATLRCKDDLYKSVDYITALKSAGGDPVAYDNALIAVKSMDEPYRSELTGKIPAFGLKGVMLGEIVTHSGQEGTAYGTLEAERQVDRWAFTTVDLQDVSANFPGRALSSVSGQRLVPLDSSEAKQLLTDEIGRERDFVTAVQAAQAKTTADKAIQEQAKQDQHAALVKSLLAATAPGKVYLGSIATTKASTRIKLVFLTQEEGGKVLGARFENSNDASQTKALKGTIMFDPRPGDNDFDLPIRLTGAHTVFFSWASSRLHSRLLAA